MRISDWSSDVCSSDLLVVKAQRLRRPAGDRQIALPADPLDLESRAQPVVAADVIAAHEGAVGRDAARIADAPARIDLKFARAFQIAAKLLGRRRRRPGKRHDRTIGGEPYAAERTETGARPKIYFHTRPP